MSRADRTLDEARMDAGYAIRMHQLHRRFYARARIVMMVIVFLGGSATFLALLTNYPTMMAVCAITVSVVSFIDLMLDLPSKRAQRLTLIQQYHLLRANSALTLEQFDAELAKIYSQSPDAAIESLRLVAFNDNARTYGLDSLIRPETGMQRLWRALA